MKILVAARACNPRIGSENYFGWSAIQVLSRDHDLWVLTNVRDRSDLEQARRDGEVPANIHFEYIGGPVRPPSTDPLRARVNEWRDYYRFSSQSLAAARALHAKVAFDLAHHVTIATWRLGSPLWRLGIPFIFGPVGGAESFPVNFLPLLSYRSMAWELVRKTGTIVSRLSRPVRLCIRNSAHVIAANAETLNVLKTIRGSENGVSLLNPGFYPPETRDRFLRHMADKAIDGSLRLFAGGQLEGRKGLAMALLALRRVKDHGVQFSYRVGGGGPEAKHLRALARRLGLTNEILFGEALSGEAYEQELGRTHIFLLPSLRESTGLTMMEAMLAGCVPIVADCGGPRHIVTPDCGYRIAVSDRDTFVERIARSILELNRDREMMRNKGKAAADRVVHHFNEEHYRSAINAIYSRVIETRPDSIRYVQAS
jgi:glycosyltransferase involved in cell wall biosynthesis